jgi:sterol desaturase/sphingolipid hydroxylase (fatty acid hydroxylase superfamily)
MYWDVLLIAFIAIALWESFSPRREGTRPTLRRWGQNWILTGLADAAGLLLRVSPVIVAAAVAASPYGVLNRPFLPLPVRVVASVLLLDFVRYLQHRGLHAIGAFWRLHQVHHSDEHFDLTTGLRFHPAESVITHLSNAAVVALLAPPLVAVVIADFGLMIQSFFAHANIRLPQRLERGLRVILVTPEMHRVHHTVRREEQNANFGAIFPFWDRLCRTYRAAPADADEHLRFGLSYLHDGEPSLAALLRMPFIGAGPAVGRTLSGPAPGLDEARRSVSVPRP